MGLANLSNKIKKLKREKNALILAHYYVCGEVQDVADYVGDSYYLSQVALNAEEEIIIFCGVHFMAESAKILSPHKTIIMPDSNADCPMAHMVTPEEIHKFKSECENLAVVCYINSTAEIKALADVCVTSSNAVRIIRQLEEKNILFVPDQNLGEYIANQILEKNFVFNKGFCCVHQDIKKEELIKLSNAIPDGKILVHPECRHEISETAEYVGSTSGIIKYASQSNAEKFIIGTEVGVFHQLEKQNPYKKFYTINDKQVCYNMKKITLAKVYDSLVFLSPTIEVDESLSTRARKPLQKMHILAQ